MSEEKNDAGEIFLIAGFFIALLAINFLIISSFADQCSTADKVCHEGLNPWYVFLMRFQTFITGVLAIVAALITVRQMRKSDEISIRLHQEALTRKSNEAAKGLEILCLCHANSIATFIEVCETFFEAIEIQNLHQENSFAKDDAELFFTAVSDMKDMLDDPSWLEYRSSLNVNSHAAIRGLQMTTEYILNRMRGADIDDNDFIHRLVDVASKSTDYARELGRCLTSGGSFDVPRWKSAFALNT